MGVGTSLGATFDDSFHQSQNQWNPDKYPSTGEVAPPASASNDDNVQSDQWTQQQRTSTANNPIQISDKVDAISIHPAPADDKPTGEPSPAVPFSPSRFSVVNAFRGMLNGSAEAVKNFPQNLTDSLKAIGDTLSLPGDVASGKVPAGSIQEIEKAADLGMMMVGGPAPVAAKMADGTLGSFAGVKATGIDKTALYKAQEMEMNGLSKDEIWNQTGFFRGAEDNRWKFEIPDKDMKLRPEAFDTTIHVEPRMKSHFEKEGLVGPGKEETTSTIGLKEQKKDFFGQSKPVMLPDVIQHPELFKQYPWLKTMKVEPTQPFNSNLGGYGVQSNTLYLKQGLEPEFAKSVIMHEVQHAIQEIEGFSKGGSPKQFKPPKLDELVEDFNKAKNAAQEEMYKKGLSPFHLDHIKAAVSKHLEGTKLSGLDEYYLEKAESLGVVSSIKNIVKSEKIIREEGQAAFDKYHQLHGEIEARNVQARMKFDWLDRQFNAPFRFKD